MTLPLQYVHEGQRKRLSSTTFISIMNRSELQDQLIQQMLDDMDLKTMTQLCYDYLDEGYAKYSDEELITECEEYYPELLEG